MCLIWSYVSEFHLKKTKKDCTYCIFLSIRNLSESGALLKGNNLPPTGNQLFPNRITLKRRERNMSCRVIFPGAVSILSKYGKRMCLPPLAPNHKLHVPGTQG